MKINRIAVSLLILSGLTACGGGGGGGGGDGGTGTVTPPPVAADAPPYTLSPSALIASHVAGYPQTINLVAKQSTPFVGVAYLKVVPDVLSVIDPLIKITPNSDGAFDVSVTTSGTAKPGRYKGNITVSVCNDPDCKSNLKGSPFNVPYDIEVIAPEGGVTTQNLPPLTPLEGAPDWGTFQGNAQHTGYVPVTLNTTAFNLRWKRRAAAIQGRLGEFQSIASGSGNIYTSIMTTFPAKDAKLKAYSEHDGSLAWEYAIGPLEYASTNPAAYANGRVYMSAGQQSSTGMYGFDAATGKLLFQSSMSSQWESYLAPTVFNGSVYTDGGAYGGLYSFSAVSGAKNYFTSLAMYDQWTPAATAKSVYALIAGELLAIDPVSGAIQSRITDPLYVWSGYSANYTSPVIGDGALVFGVNNASYSKSGITAFDTANNKVAWSVEGKYAGNPAYAEQILFAATSTKLEARKAATGEVLWTWTPAAADTAPIKGPVLVTKNLVFVSTLNKVFAIDRATHAQVWSYDAGGEVLLSANGVLYIKGLGAITAINVR